jgi:hypothetical protein
LHVYSDTQKPRHCLFSEIGQVAICGVFCPRFEQCHVRMLHSNLTASHKSKYSISLWPSEFRVLEGLRTYHPDSLTQKSRNKGMCYTQQNPKRLVLCSNGSNVTSLMSCRLVLNGLCTLHNIDREGIRRTARAAMNDKFLRSSSSSTTTPQHYHPARLSHQIHQCICRAF